MKNATRLLLLILPQLVSLHQTAAAAEPTVNVTPIVRYVTVKGDEEKLREDVWIKDDWAGGIDKVTWHHDFGNDTTLEFEGRGIFDEGDYKLVLEVARPDMGFVRAGFTEYRKYYDGTGGFFRSFSTPSFDLGSDLFLRNGNIFVELWLRLPDAPKVTVGYERKFKDGEKSLLEWGEVQEGGVRRKILPTFKDIDETVDIVKLEVEHDIKNIHLADQFRYEHFRSTPTRYEGSINLTTSDSQAVLVREEYKHDAFFNTFRMDSHLNEKVYWSLGYLYTTMDGNAALNLVTTPVVSAFDKNWLTRAVDVDSDSHVLNVSAMLGPYAGLSLYAGVQAEKTDSQGFTDALLTEGTSAATTNLTRSTTNKRSIEETAGLRYTKIPYTTLYTEGKWTQQDIDLFERETEDGGASFIRDTDTVVRRQDYTAGFNTAPLPRMALAGRYRHSIRENDYDHLVDTEDGYPAFITVHDFTTDEIMAKLTLRPCSRFRTSLKYQLIATDIDTTTESFSSVVPGGKLRAGNYDASIYSISATVTPISRLYLTGLFSYQDTRTIAFANADPSVITYHGNVYTTIGTAGYALDDKTDLTVEYSYSRSDNFTDNSADGLPLGLDNQRHGLIAGLTRRITDNMIARVRYGFYQYNETSNGGVDDYTAHMVGASCMLRF